MHGAMMKTFTTSLLKYPNLRLYFKCKNSNIINDVRIYEKRKEFYDVKNKFNNFDVLWNLLLSGGVIKFFTQTWVKFEFNSSL